MPSVSARPRSAGQGALPRVWDFKRLQSGCGAEEALCLHVAWVRLACSLS